MKHIIIAALFISLRIVVAAQSAPIDLPESTLIPHYRLSVAYNTTTVLVFPASVKPIDRGDRDILAVKQPGVENVVKVKASRKNFAPTNLHVFTSDGRIYAFDVTYSDSMASSRDLTILVGQKDTISRSRVIDLSGQLMNDADLGQAVALMRDSIRHHPLLSARYEKMTLSVDAIAQRGNLLFLHLQLRNRSNLRYQLDFMRCYLRDRQKAKRTSIQEQEIPIIYKDTTDVVAGHTRQSFVIALPIFTVAGGKEGVIEVFERNGGRSLTLRLRNKILLQAHPL